jgi:hypothetical protein
MTKSSHEFYTRSDENPNGLFEAILDPSFTESVPELDKRLAYVSADIQIYLIDVVGVDKDMAGIVAARALQEVLAAVDVSIPNENLDAILLSADAISPSRT